MLSALVVDDHPAQRLFLLRMLEAEGHTVRAAEDGHAAIIALDQTVPDILFVDWMMPGLNGLEIVRDIRSRAGGDKCYVIMLTSRAEPEDLATAFEAGVDDFMAKPVGALELRSRTKSAVRLATLHRRLSDRVNEVGRLNEDLVALNGRLETLAATDPLTGLLNRRAGARRLAEAWSVSERHGHPLSVAIIDIDHFKKVNDEFGHSRGDAAIRHVASVMTEHARLGDVVARFGGEEFVWVLPHTTATDSMICLERVRQCVERARCQADGREVRLSVSIGVAQRGGEDGGVSDPEHLLRLADAALYEAKHAGRNRICIADSVATRLRQAA